MTRHERHHDGRKIRSDRGTQKAKERMAKVRPVTLERGSKEAREQMELLRALRGNSSRDDLVRMERQLTRKMRDARSIAERDKAYADREKIYQRLAKRDREVRDR